MSCTLAALSSLREVPSTALQTPEVLRTEPVLILCQCNHAGYILQREVRTIAKGHNHAVAHLLHCSAMPHVACALALTRSLLDSSRRHSTPEGQGLHVDCHVALSPELFVKNAMVQALASAVMSRHQHHILCPPLRKQGGPSPLY